MNMDPAYKTTELHEDGTLLDQRNAENVEIAVQDNLTSIDNPISPIREQELLGSTASEGEIEKIETTLLGVEDRKIR